MADIFELFKKISAGSDADKGPVTHIVVGLGNPGDKYTYTNHNMGFLSLDYISGTEKFRIDKLKFHSLCGEHTVAGKRVLFLKPQTFMNSSGEAVRPAADFYKIPPENVIVISDDISLPVGKIRVRPKGSAGGHNGLKSIIEHLGTEEFPRIKIGVGAPPPGYDIIDWVLAQPSDADKKVLFEEYGKIFPCLQTILESGVSAAMNRFN